MRIVRSAATAFLFLHLLAASAAANPAETAPTFTEHVAPIIFENCTSCHRKGEVAPFPLVTYRDVQKRGRMIVQVTASRYMPPWYPVSGHGDFVDPLSLDPDEIDLLKRWVEAGSPEGDADKLPAMPEFTEGWQLGEPDMIVRMPKGYDVPADGPDIYRNFAVALDLDEDKWLTAIEVRPSARTVLHHIVFGMDTTGRARQMDGSDGDPGFFGMDNGGDSVGVSTSGLGGWAVGGMPRHLPMGLARSLPKGADLILRSHFHPSGKAETEQTVIGLYFTDTPPTRSMVGLQLPPAFGYAAGLDVPAGESHFELRDSFKLPVDALAVTVGGHAHYICKEMQVEATFPDGERRSIFYIDDWDFNWQNRYQYADPVELPAGTEVDVRIRYDNSDANPNNPFDPPRRIGWGLESTDEMGSVTVLLVAAREEETDTLRSGIRGHMRSSMSSSSARKSAASSFRSRVRMLDKNGDEVISDDEVPERSRAALARMDADRDGKLTFAELEQAVARWSSIGSRAQADAEPATPADRVDADVTLLDATGREHRPLETDGADASVLFFVTTDCPIANGYAPEIRSIAAEAKKSGLRFYLVHTDPDVTPEAAAAHAREYGHDAMPVLLDPEHELVDRLGITITPEAAVVLTDGHLAYRGRIDNLYGAIGKKRPAATRHDLRDALAAVAEGTRPVVSRTKAIGCIIAEPRQE